MTDTELAFLRAICLQPMSDELRLVYADYLDENGQPERAEFIRLQCQLVAEYTGFRRREWKLLSQLPRPAWTFGIEQRFGGDGGRIEWSRGFLSTLTCSWADWLRVAPEIAWGPVPCKACGGTGNGRHYDPMEIEAIDEGGCSACAGRGWTPPTMVCPECKDHPGKHGPDMYLQHYACLTCKGSRRVPRPMPPTAQPVSRVRLTTVPPLLPEFTNRFAKWPWIRFELPAAEQAGR